MRVIVLCLLFLYQGLIYAETIPHGAPASIAPNQIQAFSTYPTNIQELIIEALKLASNNLTYTYGSANPQTGGMDCSGTIYYLLNYFHIPNVPRQADQLYRWVWEDGHFYAVNSSSFSSFEFSRLKPGDLLFWSGTYEVKRDPPVTHVMLYLGENLAGKKLMFGASNGRPYQGVSRWGVSLFDFTLPSADSSSRFLGYGCIPHFSC